MAKKRVKDMTKEERAAHEKKKEKARKNRNAERLIYNQVQMLAKIEKELPGILTDIKKLAEINEIQEADEDLIPKGRFLYNAEHFVKEFKEVEKLCQEITDELSRKRHG